MEHTESSHGQGKCHPEDSSDSFLITELKRENEDLQQKLMRVVATASDNEKIWRHFAEIERILFRTRQLDQLVEELLQEVKTRFQLDLVILFLSDSDILERFFPDLIEHGDHFSDGTRVLPLPAEMQCTLCSDVPKPFILTQDDVKSLYRVLPKDGATIQAGVFIPICVHQNLFGSLLLGSNDPQRYQPGDATDLLEHLGIKIALCMDNCLTYEKLKDLSVADPLTGLLNFFQIHTILEREFRKARRFKTPLSILIVDLDYFREANGNSDVGSEVLKHAAGLLQEILPKNETHVGRYGSDEFLILLPNVPEDEAREVVPYLSQMIRKSPFNHFNTAILIQTIIAVSTLDESTKQPQDLVDAAYAELCRLKMRDQRQRPHVEEPG